MKPHSKDRIPGEILAKVLEAIGRGYYAQSKIAQHAGLPVKIVKDALQRLKSDGRIGDDHRRITVTHLERCWRRVA